MLLGEWDPEGSPAKRSNIIEKSDVSERPHLSRRKHANDKSFARVNTRRWNGNKARLNQAHRGPGVGRRVHLRSSIENK
jgi:hypothetical protein